MTAIPNLLYKTQSFILVMEEYEGGHFRKMTMPNLK